jgi:gamma-glutamyltranspeptidase/glutathione hydrolase
VACGHPLAAGAAVGVFADGGNAVDAALAAAAVLSVVLPDACGLGGDSLALVRQGGETVAYNGTGAAPAAFEGTVPGDGGGTVAVPGAVHAWETMHAAHATLPLDRLFADAVRLAREGFPAGADLVRARAAQLARLERTAPEWEVTAADPAPGERLALPRLADALERIVAGGAAAFYTGPLADAIARACAADGGALSAADLAAQETVVRPPVTAELARATLTLQPPVSQAVLAAMTLRAVEAHAPADAAVRAHLTVEAVEAAFRHRDAVALDDPGALIATELALDPERAQRRGGPVGSAHTTAIATADAEGRVVSMLISVFDDFGSAVHVPAGGFLLNDRLLGCASDPASPNAPVAGRRPVHTLSPILVEDDERCLALATPGADGQVQTLAQLVQVVVDDGVDVADALGRSRWRSSAGDLLVEAGLDPALRAALAERGHEIVDLPYADGRFGAAVAAGVDSRHGTLFAAADPRRETWAGAL